MGWNLACRSRTQKKREPQREGGQEHPDRWERWQLLATVARLIELVLELWRDHLFFIGGGPGRLT